MSTLLRYLEALPRGLVGGIACGLATALIGACTTEIPDPSRVPLLDTTRMEPLVLSSPGLRWPDFFLAESQSKYLWGEQGQIYRVEVSGSETSVSLAEERVLALGLDRQIGATRAWNETLAILDSSGQISLRDGRSRRIHSFPTHLANRAGSLAVAGDRAHVLQHGDIESITAVVTYTFEGEEVARWGEMTPDGVLQSRLKGGGIAACPDGSVYYSYINSPRILRLSENRSQRVAALGTVNRDFRVLLPRQIRAAYREALRTRSVTALVELGLSGSRVMSLFCSTEGLLVRQVAPPDRSGSQIEIWDPASEQLIGHISAGGSTLLAVGDRTVFLGSLTEQREFRLERIRFRAETGPTEDRRPTKASV